MKRRPTIVEAAFLVWTADVAILGDWQVAVALFALFLVIEERAS